jgi:MEKHLA domain
MSWYEFTTMPSNRCAEPMHREQRERFLEEVERTGVAKNYSGVRISSSGRRFRIEDVTCWNVVDSAGTRLGQAACYPRWVFL